MATIDLDLVNRALSRLALRTPVSSIEETSTEAGYAKTFYPGTLRSTLSMLDWGFARATVGLALVGIAPSPWAYQYALPADCLTPRAVLGFDDGQLATWGTPRNAFATGSAYDVSKTLVPVILTDVAGASLRYTRLVEASGLWEPGFAEAFTWALAADLALPLTGKADIQRAMLEGRAAAIGQAAVNTAQGQALTAVGEPDWIAGRGVVDAGRLLAGRPTNIPPRAIPDPEAPILGLT